MPTRTDDATTRIRHITHAVEAHAQAIEEGPVGRVTVDWGDGDIRVTVSVTYPKEPLSQPVLPDLLTQPHIG